MHCWGLTYTKKVICYSSEIQIQVGVLDLYLVVQVVKVTSEEMTFEVR